LIMPETFKDMLNLPDSETSSEKLSSSDILKFVFCVLFGDYFFEDWGLKCCKLIIDYYYFSNSFFCGDCVVDKAMRSFFY